MVRVFSLLLFLTLFLPVALHAESTEPPFNRDFLFKLGESPNAQDPAFPDTDWDRIGVPHSFSIPYFRSPHFYVGEGWYRKHFNVDELSLSDRYRLDFEGVFQTCSVYLNGKKVGGHQGGYTGFSVDLTPALKKGENLLAVQVDNKWNAQLPPRAGEHVFSGGIYRDVKLVRTGEVFIPRNGVRVSTPQVSKAFATVTAMAKVANSSNKEMSLIYGFQIFDSNGKECHPRQAGEILLRAGETKTVESDSQNGFGQVKVPELWHPDHPVLYTLKFNIYSKENASSVTIPFGIRWFEFTADRGFLLNGEPLFLRGANRHQDHAGWGDAITNSAHVRDAKMIKDCGMNFVRGSHYPHDPSFLKACDELGLLFWSENTYWGIGGFGNDGYWNCSAYPTNPADEAPFIENNKRLLGEMIDDAYNHPSVVVWSLCNEPFFVRGSEMEKSRELVRTLTAESHRLDRSRPVGVGGAQRSGFDKLGDIIGYNGDGASFPDPKRPNLVAEYGSHIANRPGVYDGTFGDVKSQPAWRSGQALWCAFHHGSIAGDMGRMGMIDYFRLPLRQWYWYRNEFAKIPPPEWVKPGKAAGLKLSADRLSVKNDGSEDIFFTVTVVDATGKPIANSPDVTLEIVSGPGELPTGKSITFRHNSDIDIREGMAAVAFRSWHGGKTLLRAVSEGLTPAEITVETVGEPQWKPEFSVQWQKNRVYRAKPVSEAAHRESRDNIAFIRPTRVSSQESRNSSDLANDGDLNTRWCAKEGSVPAWWQVDLENFYSVERVNLSLEKGGEFHYTIATSEDGSNWVEGAAMTIAEVNADRTHELNAKPRARFLRVTFTTVPAGVYPGIREIRVSGVPLQ